MSSEVTVYTGQLTPREAEINKDRQMLVTNFGDGIPFSVEHYEAEIRRELRSSAESLLRASARLLVIRECAPDKWGDVLGRLGLDRGVASRMVKLAERFAKLSHSGRERLQIIESSSVLHEMVSMPEEQFAELAETGETGSLKADELSKLTVRELRAKVRELRESLATKEERAAARERELEAKSAENRKLRRQWQSATPDEQIEQLRQDVSVVSLDIRSRVTARPSREGEEVSSLRTRAQALVEAGVSAGIDQSVYLAGVFAEIEREVRCLRDELGIPKKADADPRPEWLRDEPAGEVR